MKALASAQRRPSAKCCFGNTRLRSVQNASLSLPVACHPHKKIIKKIWEKYGMVKSLLLGTAAGLVAVAGAQAADMPVKAAPVQYVKICTLYGDGFYYIP